MPVVSACQGPFQGCFPLLPSDFLPHCDPFDWSPNFYLMLGASFLTSTHGLAKLEGLNPETGILCLPSLGQKLQAKH